MSDAPREISNTPPPETSEAVVQQIYEAPPAPQYTSAVQAHDPVNDAAVIHSFSGSGSSPANERALRTTLLGMTSDQIAKADTEYQKQYGHSMMHDLLLSDMSNGTKASLAILTQGKNNINADERQTLAELGIESRNVGLFADAMFTMPNDQRRALEAKLGPQLAGAFSGQDLATARDNLQFGRLTAAEEINQHKGNFPNQAARAEFNVHSMGLDEQQHYALGKKLTDNPPIGRGLSADEYKSKQYYDRLNGALKASGTPEQVGTWERHILNSARQGSVITTGSLFNNRSTVRMV